MVELISKKHTLHTDAAEAISPLFSFILIHSATIRVVFIWAAVINEHLDCYPPTISSDNKSGLSSKASGAAALK